MSNRVAFYKQQKVWVGNEMWVLVAGRFWYVLKDKTGKVRDWVHAANAKEAWRIFKDYRDCTGSIPKGYTVEKRGLVTKENW